MGQGVLRALVVPRERRSAVVRLQREYLEYVLVDGGIFSLPCAAMACRSEEVQPQDLEFFQVVHKGASRQKRVLTASQRSAGLKGFAVSVQRFLALGDATSQQDYALVFDDDPKVVDLLTWCDWSA